MEEILEFGQKRDNEERRDGGCAVIFDPKTKKYAVYNNLRTGLLGLYGGGFDENEDELAGTLREVKEESGLNDFLHVEKIGKVLTHYYNTNKKVNRVAHATCFLIVLRSNKEEPTKLEEHEKFELVWATREDVMDNWLKINENNDYDHWIYFLEKGIKRLNELGHL